MIVSSMAEIRVVFLCRLGLLFSSVMKILLMAGMVRVRVRESLVDYMV